MKQFLKDFYQIWIKERPSQYAAALAYYSMFSFAPVIYVAYVVAGFFMRQISVDEIQLNRLEETLGPEVAQYLQSAVENLGNTNSSGSAFFTVIGFLVLLYAASGLFYQLQFVLNSIFKAPLPEQGSTWRLVRQRLLAFLGVIGLGVFLAISTVAGILFSIVDHLIGPNRSLPQFDLLLSLISVSIVFTLIYKFLPERNLTWQEVWPAGIIAAVLITLGGKFVSLFLAGSRVTSAQDAASSFAMILVSYYYFAQVFVLGAVFIRVNRDRAKTKTAPESA